MFSFSKSNLSIGNFLDTVPVMVSDEEARQNLDALIRDRRDSFDNVSRLIGRNAAYIQQYVRRGSPRRLAEQDRRRIARYFGVAEEVLGAPINTTAAVRDNLVSVRRYRLGASAGPGTLHEDDALAGAMQFDPQWLRSLGVKAERASLIRVEGDSMEPTLCDGDDILVDPDDAAARLRAGIYVIRHDGTLKVKRLALDGSGRIAILSDNAEHVDLHDVSLRDVDIVGRVVFTARRLR